MHRTAGTARLAAGPGVGIRRDAALPTPPPRPPRGAGAALVRRGGGRPVEEDALRGRALRPLPGRRPVAVPPRRGRPGGPPALLPPELDGRLVGGDGAERVERGRRLRGVDARLGRLVPQGL